MINIVKKEECNGCHACNNICPKDCISMEIDDEGFWYPKVDLNKCIDCSLCEKVCPIINIPERDDKETIAYACKNKNDEIRMTSSSGGVFTLLCKYVIYNGGVVFGAAFDENLNVIHSYSETVSGCEKFKGSKYVQSKIGDTYKKAKQFLNHGKIVMFSGTPCQIAGLTNYLMKKYDNLILIDVACHGVPSPLVYRKYVDNIQRENSEKIKSMSFRDKSTGWNTYSFKVEFNDGKIIKELGYDNTYMKGYLKDIYLRPTCYECDFKKPITSADITLADYWGVKEKHPDFYDEKGVSLILLNSIKGKSMFNKISANIDYIATDFDYATKCNPSIINPVKYNQKRELFFNDINEGDIDTIINRYIKVPLIQKVKGKIKNVLGKLKIEILKRC